MRSADVLTDASNRMNSFSNNNGIKSLWDSRLRTYRGASLDAPSSGSGSTSMRTPLRRSSSSSVLLGKTTRTPSTASRGSSGGGDGGLTDSEHRSSTQHRRDSAALPDTTPSAAASTPGTGAAAIPRGRASTASSLKRRAASSTAAAVGSRTPVSPQHQRQRSSSPLAKPLFRNGSLLMELGPHDAPPLLTLVLDLDETLVSNRSAHLTQAILRPYCLHVLHALRHMHGLEIVLWTASTKETASPVVDQLHALGPIFDDIIFRNDLWFTDGIHTKDLRLLGRDMDHVLIVDNAANCCKLNPRNALLIEDFHGFRHEEDAALVNVYYTVEALLKLIKEEGMSVRDGLAQLADEGNLCQPIVLTLPEVWRSLPLTEIAPLKIPPHGSFFKSNTPPPSRSIMKYWKY